MHTQQKYYLITHELLFLVRHKFFLLRYNNILHIWLHMVLYYRISVEMLQQLAIYLELLHFYTIYQSNIYTIQILDVDLYVLNSGLIPQSIIHCGIKGSTLL